MKDNKICLRISTELKQNLEQQAKQQNITLSKYIVGFLQADLKHPCQKSQNRICMIETYKALKQGDIEVALKLLEKELNKDEK